VSDHGHIVLAWDGQDEGAAARRAQARPEHMAVLARWASAGRFTLGVPLFRDDGATVAGSLMVFAREDEVGMKEYLAEEPFARAGVWQRYEVVPFRLAALPWRPLPTEGEAPREMTHVATLAWDGDDADAPARRAAQREAHFARVRAFAEDGTLTLGGAVLDTGGAMRGSLAVTRHASVAAAEAFWAEDPYVAGGVWRRVERYPTRIAPLPYRTPGA
jgi:uncharacterized protein YciI